VKAAWVREPLKRLKAYLVAQKAWSEQDEETWKTDCGARVDIEINAYLETKSQPVEAMFDYTYAEVPTDLAAQKADVLALEKNKLKPHG
jgi:pyruvate dehydrogenase E1 component alpha subunit